MEYEGARELVHAYLIQQTEPVYHEEIEAALNLPSDHVGQALMDLWDAEKADWPGPTKWVAASDDRRTIDGENARIHVGIIYD